MRRGDERRGDVRDASRLRHPTKLRKGIEEKESCRGSGRESKALSSRYHGITNIADVGISEMSIRKILDESEDSLEIPRKK